jgi:hypothetical protein
MKRSLSFLLSVMMLVVSCIAFSGCLFTRFGPDPDPAGVIYTINKTERRVEIYIDELNNENLTLIDVMEQAKQSGELIYEISAGMVTSIEGLSNTPDFQSCWMLYTSDVEMSNVEWGTIMVGKETLGSAIVGAEDLPIIAGGLYVWDYFTFWDY